MRPDCRQNGTARTYYYYDGGTPAFETDVSGTVTAQNVFANDGLVARYQGSAWIFYTFDQQGNVSERLDVGASVLCESIYDSYGMEACTGSPADPFGYNAYCGYIFDREIGLYYCRNRYYDPSVGRWINRDPIGFEGGTNLFGYCGDCPLGNIDPVGTDVIVLNDEKEVWGKGHQAILIGNDKDGWNYYCREGYGQPTTHRTFKTLDEFRKSQIARRYTRGLRRKTTRKVDRKMLDYAFFRLENSERYGFLDDNCADMVNQLLKAGGISTDDMPSTVGVSVPNDQYDWLSKAGLGFYPTPIKVPAPAPRY